MPEAPRGASTTSPTGCHHVSSPRRDEPQARRDEPQARRERSIDIERHLLCATGRKRLSVRKQVTLWILPRSFRIHLACSVLPSSWQVKNNFVASPPSALNLFAARVRSAPK